jgi:hypothetical protein
MKIEECKIGARVDHKPNFGVGTITKTIETKEKFEVFVELDEPYPWWHGKLFREVSFYKKNIENGVDQIQYLTLISDENKTDNNSALR